MSVVTITHNPGYDCLKHVDFPRTVTVEKMCTSGVFVNRDQFPEGKTLKVLSLYFFKKDIKEYADESAAKPTPVKPTPESAPAKQGSPIRAGQRGIPSGSRSKPAPVLNGKRGSGGGGSRKRGSNTEPEWE